MPIYEYRCQTCGKKFDALRLISQADSQINCRYCQGNDTHRMISACYSHSTGGVSLSSQPSSGGCGGCNGGSCGSCRH